MSYVDIITNYKQMWILEKNESKLWKSLWRKRNKKYNWLNKIEFLEIERNIGITDSMEKLLLPVIVGTRHIFWKLMTRKLGKIIFRYQTLNSTRLSFQREKN